MPSACNDFGIIPNPDISGIGVRAAIYAQAVLTLIQPIIASIDGRISEKELVGLHRLYLGILLPGCALLVSAIIQATTQGLSVYHAIIVLQLSWINNTSALIFFQFALIVQIGLEEEREFRHRVGMTLKLFYKVMKTTTSEDENGIRRALKERAFTWKDDLIKQKKKFPQSEDMLDEVVQNLSALRAAITDDSERRAGPKSEVKTVLENKEQRKRLLQSLGVVERDSRQKPWWMEIGRGLQTMINVLFPKQVTQLLSRDWIMTTLASAHLTLFAAFGVWVWFTIYQFGDCDTRNTRLAILPGVNIQVTSPLRVWFIVLYIICVMPFLNIVFIGALEFLIVQPIFSLRSWSPSGTRQPQELQESAHPPEEKKWSKSRINFYLAGFIVLTLLVQVYFILTTELTIRTNRRLLADSGQEGDWTFGQTLAVALVAIPLIDVVKECWEQREEVGIMINGLVAGLGLRRLLFWRHGPEPVELSFRPASLLPT